MTSSLLGELQRQRWFAAKGRVAQAARVVDGAEWRTETGDYQVRLEFVAVSFVDGGEETYVLVRAPESADLDALATGDPRAATALLPQFRAEARVRTQQGGLLVFSATSALEPVERAEPRLLGAEQSNTSVRFGDVLVLKVFRRLQPGISPEIEMGRFLTECTTFRNMPLLAGFGEYVHPDTGERSALSVLQSYVPNCGDAWRTTLARLAYALDSGHVAPAVEPLRRLGMVTAEMHAALASASDDPAFAPELITAADSAAWTRAMEAELDHTLGQLAQRGITVQIDALTQRIHGIAALEGSLKTRHHGDFHLGQVLEQDSGDYVVIDFEGEPARPVEVRREKRSPLRDVAGMLRSLDYARHAALRSSVGVDARRQAHARAWYEAARAAFLDAYTDTLAHAERELLPGNTQRLLRALAALEAEKAAYEVRYELNNRPDWLDIPLAALTAP